MTLPKRQHFVPQFYLRRWCISGKCVVYKRFGDKLSILSKPPVSVGFEVDLYTNHHASDDKTKYDIEDRVLRRIDNDAADALRHFEEVPKTPMSQRLRYGWARFLMSLLHRAPDRVSELRRDAARKSQEIIGEMRDKYPDLAGKADEDIVSKADIEELHQNLLKMLIDSERIGGHLVKMHWRHVQMLRVRFGLLTGDRPLMRSNGIGGRAGFLILPTSPTSYFIACTDRRTADAFESQKPEVLERALNDAVIRQSQNFVVSQNEAQTSFIRKRVFDGMNLQKDNLGDVTWANPHHYEPWELV